MSGQWQCPAALCPIQVLCESFESVIVWSMCGPFPKQRPGICFFSLLCVPLPGARSHSPPHSIIGPSGHKDSDQVLCHVWSAIGSADRSRYSFWVQGVCQGTTGRLAPYPSLVIRCWCYCLYLVLLFLLIFLVPLLSVIRRVRWTKSSTHQTCVCQYNAKSVPLQGRTTSIIILWDLRRMGCPDGARQGARLANSKVLLDFLITFLICLRVGPGMWTSPSMASLVCLLMFVETFFPPSYGGPSRVLLLTGFEH